MAKPLVFRERFSFNKSEIYREKIYLGNSGVALEEKPHLSDAQVKNFKEREKLGIFGRTNDTNGFHPGTNATNIIPKPEDFVKQAFRMLSATIVAGHSWRSTDFSDAEMLRKSVPLLAGKPLYTDHDTELSNFIGHVANPRWEDAYTDSLGNKVPAGINGDFMVDAVIAPWAARGMLQGAINSDSVTVDFEYTPSHTDIPFDEWRSLVGQLDKNGKMYTRKATKIVDYYEVSPVFLGADPFAKLINDKGELTRIDYSSVVEFSKEPELVQNTYTKSNKYFVNACLSKQEIISLRSNYSSIEQNTNSDTMTEVEIFLRSLLGLAADVKITADHLKLLTTLKEGEVVALSSDLAIKDTTVSTLTAQVTTLTAQVSELATVKTELAAAKILAEIGTASLTSKRDEVKRLYSLTVDGKTDPVLLETFDKSDNAALDAFLLSYGGKAANSFTGTCRKCNSQDISFQSSKTGEELAKEVTPVKESRSLSFDEIAEKYKNR